MRVGAYEYDDGDDYGIPTLRPLDSKTRARILIRRYRPWVFFAVFLLAVWWFVRSPSRSLSGKWSRFAYVQYASDAHSMCNALMVFEALHRLGSKADRVLLFPREWNDQIASRADRNSELLDIAQRVFGVKTKPIQLLGIDGAIKPGTLNFPTDWHASITKLRAFELEGYDRVLYLDSDVTLQHHMDELFSLPSTPIAMPRMYWDGSHQLSSLIMLIEPNADETRNLFERLQQWRLDPSRTMTEGKYDLDLLNERFGSSAMILPHRPYVLVTSELRRTDHNLYLGTINGPQTLPRWNPDTAVAEAKLIHFSDWPLPKPWMMWPTDGVLEMQPGCEGRASGTCREREIWKGLYDDFRRRRKDICRILSVPAPVNWEEYKNATGAGGG